MRNAEDFKKQTGMRLIGWSSVWSYHSIDKLENAAFNKRSNLNRDINNAFKTGVDSVTLIVSGIGRSGHGKTKVAIFEGATNMDNYNNYYSKGCAEVFASNFK